MSQKAAVSKGTGTASTGNAGKSKGNLLSKPGKGASKSLPAEAELLRKSTADIKPEDVLSLEAATEGQLAGVG